MLDKGVYINETRVLCVTVDATDRADVSTALTPGDYDLYLSMHTMTISHGRLLSSKVVLDMNIYVNRIEAQEKFGILEALRNST